MDVHRNQGPAGPDRRRASGAQYRRSGIWLSMRLGGDGLGQPLVLSPTDVHQKPTLLSHSRLGIEIDGNPELLGYTLAYRPRDLNAHRHRRLANWHEGENVECADARMSALVLTEVDIADGGLCQPKGAFTNVGRLASHRDDRSIVVAVRVNVEHRHPRGPCRVGETLDNVLPPPLAHVRDVLHQGPARTSRHQ